jgi:hypothetical protein
MSHLNPDLETSIEKLLHSYECVILPDFGGFITRDSPCNFNISKDKLKPYGKHIFFNPHLQQNDGLLYNHIQKSYGLTYSEAIAFYQSWLGGIRQGINDSGSRIFGRLGTFYKGNENNVWFSPLSTLNLAVESYGLFPVEVKQLVVEEKPSDIHLEQEIRQVEDNVFTLADNRPIESFEPARLNYKGWLVAASIALIAHIGYLKFETTDVTVNEASLLPVIEQTTPPVDSVEIADSASSHEVQPETPVEAAPETVTTETPAVTETPVAEPAPSPAIQQASVIPQQTPAPAETAATPVKILAKYKLENNATYHRNDLIRQGVQAEVRQNGEWFEVVTEGTIQ